MHYTWVDFAERIDRDFILDLGQKVLDVQSNPVPESEQEELLLKYKTPSQILAINLKSFHARETANRKVNLARSKREQKRERELRQELAKEREEQLEFDKAKQAVYENCPF